MAIEIVGDPKDVKRYREILHKKGEYTKSFYKSNPVLAEKPEGFRLMNGIYHKKNMADANTKGVFEFDPEKDRLEISGTANAKIIDRMDEVVLPEGLDAKNFLKNPVLLSDHMYFTQSVIGSVTLLRPESEGIMFDAFIGDPRKARLTENQTDIRSLTLQGLLQTVSIGFLPQKIIAPKFDDDGKLMEPAIVERFELLELSVVAVPANPDATFEMRQFAKKYHSLGGLNTSKPVQSQKQNMSSNNRTYSVILSTEYFTEKTATEYALDNNYRVLNTEHNDEAFVFVQRSIGDFQSDTFRNIHIDDGITLVVGNLIEGKLMEEKLATELSDGIKTIVTELGAIGSSMKRSIELSETILGNFESKAQKPVPPEEDEDKPPMDDEEDEDDEDKKALLATIATQKTTIDSLAKDIKEMKDTFEALMTTDESQAV